ncbi:hypothetical protein, partial [Sphingobacterium sp. IITKGP-BTPF85]|uniref:hypothetical protein n=1 Tax=Sphingobacterium sp. IITKGP-BTPF85 TaxID=1338009 RepID=UPI001E2EA868
MLISDWVFNNVDLDGEEDYFDGQEYVYHLLGTCLKKTAELQLDNFLSFFDEYKDSKYESILRLII